MSASSDYLMAGAPTELERLRLQARVFEPHAEAMLDAIGIQPGWRCVDIGCGAMGILGPLARRAGASGHVVGTDTDPMMLGAAQAYLAEAGASADGSAPVELTQDDVYSSKLPSESFDLVHARFEFCLLGRDAELLAQMLRLTRPGGVVAAQDPDAGSWSLSAFAGL